MVLMLNGCYLCIGTCYELIEISEIAFFPSWATTRKTYLHFLFIYLFSHTLYRRNTILDQATLNISRWVAWEKFGGLT